MTEPRADSASAAGPARAIEAISGRYMSAVLSGLRDRFQNNCIIYY